MATVAKTIVATGASSGIGFELARQLLSQTHQPYRLILGARDVARTLAAFRALGVGDVPHVSSSISPSSPSTDADAGAGPDPNNTNRDPDPNQHSLSLLPLDLADLPATRAFARQVLDRLGPAGKIDVLLLNAAVSDPAGDAGPGPRGSRWCTALIVNHLAQHYLVHLLREKLVASASRIVFVSSGAVRRVQDTSTLERDLQAGSGVVDGQTTYSQTKFVQLLGAHWWRRQLAGQCAVVAVSPGLIPNTGIGRGSGMRLTMDMPDAKTVPEGAASVLRAFTRDDFPADPDQIFLTSWGEWWSKDVYRLTLDRTLQDQWCPSKEEIEREEGLAG